MSESKILGVRVAEKFRVEDKVGASKGVEFNAIGLLKVDPETGVTEIVQKEFVKGGKEKMIFVEKGRSVFVLCQLEVV